MPDPIQNSPEPTNAGAGNLYPEGAPNAREEGTPPPAATPSSDTPVAAADPPAAEPSSAPSEGTAAGGEPAPALTLESYEIKLPEDFQVEDTLLGDFKKAALDAAMPPDKAQAFVDLYAAASRAQVAATVAETRATQERWQSEIAGLPEFQGERRTQSLAMLQSAMREYGSPEAAQFLNESGAGNNPALVRYILKLTSGLAEGRVAPAGGPVPKDLRSIGEVFYPGMKKA